MSDNSRAVSSLLKIMSNNGALLRHRLEAAEALLSYEVAEEVTERAKSFLAAVFESDQVGVEDKLEALKLTRKAEARKVTQGNVRYGESDKNREIWRNMEISARRMKLIRAGLWQIAVDQGTWADDLMSPDYLPPSDGRTFSDLFDD